MSVSPTTTHRAVVYAVICGLLTNKQENALFHHMYEASFTKLGKLASMGPNQSEKKEIL